jgi:hypothetical protein
MTFLEHFFPGKELRAALQSMDQLERKLPRLAAATISFVSVSRAIGGETCLAYQRGTVDCTAVDAQAGAESPLANYINCCPLAAFD